MLFPLTLPPPRRDDPTVAFMLLRHRLRDADGPTIIRWQRDWFLRDDDGRWQRVPFAAIRAAILRALSDCVDLAGRPYCITHRGVERVAYSLAREARAHDADALPAGVRALIAEGDDHD